MEKTETREKQSQLFQKTEVFDTVDRTVRAFYSWLSVLFFLCTGLVAHLAFNSKS